MGPLNRLRLLVSASEVQAVEGETVDSRYGIIVFCATEQDVAAALYASNQSLIIAFSGLFGFIDDQDLDRALLQIKLEAELLLQRCETQRMSFRVVQREQSYRRAFVKWCNCPSMAGTKLVPLLQAGQNMAIQSLLRALPWVMWW